MSTNTKTTTRWIAGFVMAAGLGTAIVGGGAVASADTTAPQPPTNPWTKTEKAPGRVSYITVFSSGIPPQPPPPSPPA